MKALKYWTLDHSRMNDDEFQELVEDLERFVLELNIDCAVPQRGSEGWLDQFVRRYSRWPLRRFDVEHQRPLRSYFMIDTRYSEVA